MTTTEKSTKEKYITEDIKLMPFSSRATLTS